MDEEDHLPPQRRKQKPADSAYVYTHALERFAGAAVDVVFLHIILIPLSVPAIDWAFRLGSAWPAALVLVVYFTLLLLLLRFRGLTPGGVPMGYRVKNLELAQVSWASAWRRLAPYMIIQVVSLWRLHVALQGFADSGEEYAFDETKEIIQAHGGLWNVLVIGLNGFVISDLILVLQSPRNQSLTDKLAGTLVVSPAE
jgi:uncharacterized RDD family membrane protein YckC